MSQTARWARWSVIGLAILVLLWLAALIGGSSPAIRRLPVNVHGPQVADYRAESPLRVAPLSPDVTSDASRDQASRGGHPGPTGSPSPSGSGGPTPSASGTSTVMPSLPTLPVPTPTLPTATPTLPTATPTIVPTPTLPTPPPLP